MIEVIWLNFQKGSYLLMVLLYWPFNSLYYSPSLGKVALHDFVTCLAAQATSKDVALSTQTSNELKGRWTLHQPKSSNWPEMTTFHTDLFKGPKGGFRSFYFCLSFSYYRCDDWVSNSCFKVNSAIFTKISWWKNSSNTMREKLLHV